MRPEVCLGHHSKILPRLLSRHTLNLSPPHQQRSTIPPRILAILLIVLFGLILLVAFAVHLAVTPQAGPQVLSFPISESTQSTSDQVTFHLPPLPAPSRFVRRIQSRPRVRIDPVFDSQFKKENFTGDGFYNPIAPIAFSGQPDFLLIKQSKPGDITFWRPNWPWTVEISVSFHEEIPLGPISLLKRSYFYIWTSERLPFKPPDTPESNTHQALDFISGLLRNVAFSDFLDGSTQKMDLLYDYFLGLRPVLSTDELFYDLIREHAPDHWKFLSESKELFQDGWGHSILLRTDPRSRKIKLWSRGPNGLDENGTEDDLITVFSTP